MSWFNLFSKPREVSFSQFEELFREEKKNRDSLEQQKQQQWLDKRSEIIRGIHDDIEILKNATLRNPDIPERAKHFMEGNRTAYARRVFQFVECKTLQGEPNQTTFGLFQNELHGFAASTAKPYAILQEFFAHEAQNIALKIKQLEKLMHEFETIKDKDIVHLGSLLDKVNNHDQKIKDIQHKKSVLIKEIKKQQELIVSLKKQELKLETSNEFQAHKLLTEKAVLLEKEEHRIKQLFRDKFASLERGLKKYEHLSLESKKISQYLHSPLRVLDEKNTDFIEILSGLRRSIEQGGIDLKDRKEKTLVAIASMDTAYLTMVRNAYLDIQHRVDEIKQKLAENEILDKINDLKRKIHDENSLLEKKKKEESNIKKEFPQHKKDDLLKEIESSGSKLFKQKLILK